MLNQHCAFNGYVIILMFIDKLRTHFKTPLEKSLNIKSLFINLFCIWFMFLYQQCSTLSFMDVD